MFYHDLLPVITKFRTRLFYKFETKLYEFTGYFKKEMYYQYEAFRKSIANTVESYHSENLPIPNIIQKKYRFFI